MMKPIYFPFTTISESAARNLSRLLGPLIVFTPRQASRPDFLKLCEENGWIEVKAPWTGDEDRLKAFFNEFKDWGHRHHGLETSLKAAFETGFYNQTFVSQIRADIVKSGEKSSETQDPVFLARLFLIMAEDLYLRQLELDRDLSFSALKEKELFSRMTGDEKNPAPAGENPFQPDPGEYMTAERLAAWFRLMQKSAPDSAFLVTDSPAVGGLVKERLKGMDRLAVFDRVSFNQTEGGVLKFNRMVAHLATTPWSGRMEGEIPALAGSEFSSDDGQGANLTLYIVPESAPGDLGRFFLKGGDPQKTHENKYLNTIIGILEPPGKKYKKT